jgi:uncharacterized membrane protein (UPF0127 family)
LASSGAARDLTGENAALQSSDLHTPPHAGNSRAPGATAFVLAAALAALAACSKTASGPVVTVHSAKGDVEVAVELALTREALTRGLMYRTELDEGDGMLFVFGSDAERSFWMSNTPISLDIIYIRGDATIGSIASHTTPFSEKMIPSRGPARYVLEVPAGWSERHGVKPGDRLTLPDLSGARKAGD